MAAVTQSGLKKISAIAGVGVLALLAVYRFGTPGRQARNKELADEHIAKHSPTIAAQARFQKLRFAAAYWWETPHIQIHGIVGREDDLGELWRLWERTAPPLPTAYKVVAIGEAAFAEMAK